MPPSDSRYAIVAEKPASSSYGAVPVSNLRPTGIDRRGPRLVRPPRLEQLVPSVREPEVRAAELVRRAEEHVAAERLHVDRLVRRVVHRVDPARARPPRARARRRAATSVIVPTAFDAATHATTRTRSSSFRSRSSRSSRRSSVTSIQSTSKPRSAASSTHGATPPSWSSRDDEDPVALLPVARRRAREHEVERRHVRAEDHVVGRAVEEAAGVARAPSSRIASTRLLVSYGAPMFALASRSVRAIASPTSSGTCEPPGASRKTKSPCSDENRRAHRLRRRVASSPWSEPTWADGIRVSRIILGCGNFGGIGSAPAFFGQGETPRARRSRSWTPPGRRASRPSTPPTRTAAAAARRGSATGCARRAPDVRDGSSLDEDVQPDGRRRGPRPRAARACKRQLESSLQRLGVERVDLYLTHDWDPDVPIAETAGALDELVARRARSARTALSNVDGAQLREALAVGRPCGWVQNSYSLLDREAEHEVLPLCARARARLHAVQPARRRLAHRQVPARRAAARRLADDDAARAVRAPADDAVFDLLEDLERRATEQGTTRLRSRSRGSSRTRL